MDFVNVDSVLWVTPEDSGFVQERMTEIQG